MENIYKNTDVIELNYNDFTFKNNTIYIQNNNKLNGILVIYAPWCSYCVISKDMWTNFADLFKYKFNIFSLNTYNFKENNQNILKHLDISSYPTYMTINKNGKIELYDGKTTEQDLLKYIIKNSQ